MGRSPRSTPSRIHDGLHSAYNLRPIEPIKLSKGEEATKNGAINFAVAKSGLVPSAFNGDERRAGEEEEEEETDDKKSSGLDRAKSRSVEQRNATVAGVNSRSRCPSCSGLSAYQRDVSTNRSAFVP